VAAPLVALHVAANTEGLAAPGVRALEGLLAGVRVAVDSQAARTAECLVAGLADVAVLALRVRRAVGRVEVVVVLPRVGTSDRNRHRWWEGLGKRTLVEEAVDLGQSLCRRGCLSIKACRRAGRVGGGCRRLVRVVRELGPGRGTARISLKRRRRLVVVARRC
jgi:hypothetical protein